MVKYTRLWETMKEKKVSQYRLIKYYGISAGQISRLKKKIAEDEDYEYIKNVRGMGYLWTSEASRK